jgi:hypothetical protein
MLTNDEMEKQHTEPENTDASAETDIGLAIEETEEDSLPPPAEELVQVLSALLGVDEDDG